jgi:hypothetical protein
VFYRLKKGRLVVYPMEAQLRLLLDANVAGEGRVFGLESLAADPLFVHLAGGVVPSIDTVYRDMCRFDDEAIIDLESLMAKRGLDLVRHVRAERLHVAVTHISESRLARRPYQSTRYHGRGYHPILIYCRGERLCRRPCSAQQQGLGENDAPTIGHWLRRFQEAVGSRTEVTMRIDAGGDCGEIFAAVHETNTRFIAKAKLSADLSGAIQYTTKWTTVDSDAEGRPMTQVAEIRFKRASWKHDYRVVAMRTRERDNGKQVQLWSDLDYTVHAYVTNDLITDAGDVAFEYDGRAEIEPAIGELKYGWGIGKIPSQDFHANHAVFLLKLLGHNLLRSFIQSVAPHLTTWRVPWLRRALINIPGRLLRSGRRWSLRMPPQSQIKLE